jgi:hypothetical protein
MHNRKIIDWIFRASKTLKDGTTVYARDYGLKAFRIPIYEDEAQ